MRKSRIKTNVLKRRFKVKKNPSSETVDITGLSSFTTLIAPRYYDSEIWALYEALFNDHAIEFYSKSGADRYNHDALDLEIEKQFQDELQHYMDQHERHLEALEAIHTGVERESVITEERIHQVEARLSELNKELDEKLALFNSFNRKVG